MENFILEVCSDSVESAINAEKGGANRIELCSNLIIGGTTPTTSFFNEVKKNINIPINVLLRPRFGDFLYSDYEIKIIKNEVKMFRELGANGIVIGVLTPDGKIDVEKMKLLMSEKGTMKVTCHRAFDVCCNPFEAYEELKKLGVDTILTSGQGNNCFEGREVLKELVLMSREDKGNKSPEIMVGSGLNLSNVEEIKDYTNANVYHFSGKKLVESKMKYRKENVHMGLKEFSEYENFETSEENVRKMVEILKRI